MGDLDEHLSTCEAFGEDIDALTDANTLLHEQLKEARTALAAATERAERAEGERDEANRRNDWGKELRSLTDKLGMLRELSEKLTAANVDKEQLKRERDTARREHEALIAGLREMLNRYENGDGGGALLYYIRDYLKDHDAALRGGGET